LLVSVCARSITARCPVGVAEGEGRAHQSLVSVSCAHRPCTSTSGVSWKSSTSSCPFCETSSRCCTGAAARLGIFSEGSPRTVRGAWAAGAASQFLRPGSSPGRLPPLTPLVAGRSAQSTGRGGPSRSAGKRRSGQGSARSDRRGILDPTMSLTTTTPQPAQEAVWPAIGVIMPILNEERHLEEAVAAVLGQDYPGAIELVLALGPSDDRTDEIATRTAARQQPSRTATNPTDRAPA